MTSRGSTRVIFLLIVAVLAFAAAVSTFLSWQKEKNKRVNLEVQLDGLEKRKKDLELILNASKKESFELKNKLSQAEAELLSMNAQFDNEKSEKNRLSRELGQLKSEFKQANDTKLKVETELLQAKKELGEMKAKVGDLLKAKQSLEVKLKDLEAGASDRVELGKIIISPKKTDKFQAQILSVNKEYNFVVINLGQKYDFKTSDVFFVETASGESLGKAYVEEAKEVMSVLTFTEKDITAKLKEGEPLILKVEQ